MIDRIYHYHPLNELDIPLEDLIGNAERAEDGLLYNDEYKILLPNIKLHPGGSREDERLWDICSYPDERHHHWDCKLNRDVAEDIRWFIRPGTKVIYHNVFNKLSNSIIHIPKSVKKIGRAFRDCDNLTLIWEEKPSYDLLINDDAFALSRNISFSYFEGDKCVSLDCWCHNDKLITFNNAFIKPTQHWDKWGHGGIITLPHVYSINEGILFGAEFLDAREYCGSLGGILNGLKGIYGWAMFAYPEALDEICSNIIVSHSQFEEFTKENSEPGLGLVDLEREDTTLIKEIDYDERFQSKDPCYSEIVYSPGRTRVIKAANSNPFVNNEYYAYSSRPKYSNEQAFLNGKDCSLDKNVKVICDYAFAYWDDLEEIHIPNQIKKIGKGAFLGCRNLRKITLPMGLEVIEEETFAYCSSLERITIPASVKTIRKDAFMKCKLSEVILPNSIKVCSERAFDDDTIYRQYTPIGIVDEFGRQYGGLYMERFSRGCLPCPSKGFEEFWGEYYGRLHFFPEPFDDIDPRGQNYRFIDFSRQSHITLDDEYYMFIDTETSGLPKNNIPPRLVELAWIITDRNGNVLSGSNRLIKPKGFIIEDGAIKVHGISDKIAQKYGSYLIDVLEDFLANLKHIVFIVGHNIEFDSSVLLGEMSRSGIQNMISKIPTFDTMKMGISYAGGYDQYGRKQYPKLTDLYQSLFNTRFESAHMAICDCYATKYCFFKMKQMEADK